MRRRSSRRWACRFRSGHRRARRGVHVVDASAGGVTTSAGSRSARASRPAASGDQSAMGQWSVPAVSRRLTVRLGQRDHHGSPWFARCKSSGRSGRRRGITPGFVFRLVHGPRPVRRSSESDFWGPRTLSSDAGSSDEVRPPGVQPVQCFPGSLSRSLQSSGPESESREVDVTYNWRR